ncbi:MAG: RNA polymerase sigma factor [Micromonosporaceae bacterium]
MSVQTPEGSALTEVVRAEHGRIVGALVRRYGDVELAEDAVSEALEAAWQRWPADGVPPNPGAWLTTTAHHKALDRLRRESTRFHREKEATAMLDTPADPLGVVDDDRLRLLFMCCHPALAMEARVALTLRLVAGLTVAEIAACFLMEERALAQRVTRAKRKIQQARIPFRVPQREDLPERLSGVLAALYLTFNEGYLSVGGDSGTRPDLADEAIRITRQLVELMPAEPEAQGLLALMLLTRAREAARVVDGRLVLLDEQDRSRWNLEQVAEGRRITRALLGLGRPGPYQVQAAISAAHTDERVRWDEVVGLYDLLLSLAPTPVVRLNRALAIEHTEGPQAALALVEPLALTTYHPWHVARAHLLRRLGRHDEANRALDAALALDPTPLERDHLARLRTTGPGGR